MASASSSIVVYVAGAYVYYKQFPAANASIVDEVRWVFYANEQIAVFTYGVDVRFHLSGFLFEETPSGRLDVVDRAQVAVPPDPAIEGLQPST